jgi:hypothetical protein
MCDNSPELTRRITDVVDEIIPTMAVHDEMPALIARVRQCIFKAAAREQVSYEILLAAASAEISTITKERTERASMSVTQCEMFRAKSQSSLIGR